MDQIMVVYWSRTGNTEAMAKCIGEGIQAAGKEAKVVDMDSISADELKDCSVFAMGASAMGDEELDDGTAEPVCRGSRKICCRQENCTVWFL